ncbi:hypothetical protein AYM40_34460 [Paraburkholderia phytofirmans OLGA172]|uniref:Uncharacterized protein n=1 Tax=Paraburkholderia phytofirmans OLGA172 TaxID=1417228 RepID=A0A160FV65_9BURK|nr:hypothetical protein AYM40_34460 [Paraburkholderia phytofirmans OLGA172]
MVKQIDVDLPPFKASAIPFAPVVSCRRILFDSVARATRSYVRFAFESGRATRGGCLRAKPSSDS